MNYRWIIPCFQAVYMNLLQAYLCSALSTVETISMIFANLVNFYLQIQDSINLISMSTAYLELFHANLSEIKLFQCVSMLFRGTSTILHGDPGHVPSVSPLGLNGMLSQDRKPS